jgi:DNA-binding beta-propeller fold protein YncE
MSISRRLWCGLLALGTPFAVLAAPTVYIPLGSGNQVIAVDAATNRITASYSNVENPHGLVATPDGEYLIAGSLSETPLPAGAPHDTPNSKLFLIHPAHGHVMSTVPVAGWTHHQAITPDGRYILSTHPTRGSISVLDRVANKISHTIPTGPSPNYTLITRDGRRAYVSNSGNNTISEVDLTSWRVTRALESGPAPEHMAFSADEKQIYVANPQAGTVSEVSVDSGKVARTSSVGKDLHGLDISDDRRTLFASSKKEDKLVAIDTQSGKQRTLALSPAPYHLNNIRGTGKVYVSSRKEPKIWVVDQKTLKLVGTIALPAGEGHQMAVVQ